MRKGLEFAPQQMCTAGWTGGRQIENQMENGLGGAELGDFRPSAKDTTTTPHSHHTHTYTHTH